MSTIIIVDDNASARETLVAMLEGQDYQIELAEDAFHALQILGQIQPDLILLDVMMPGMDEYISKPVNLRMLAKTIQKLLLLRTAGPV